MKLWEEIPFSLDEREVVITSAGDAACCIGGKSEMSTVFRCIISQDSVSFCSSMIRTTPVNIFSWMVMIAKMGAIKPNVHEPDSTP